MSYPSTHILVNPEHVSRIFFSNDCGYYHYESRVLKIIHQVSNNDKVVINYKTLIT